MYTIYHWFVLFLAVMFAVAAMIEITNKHRKPLIVATMAFTSFLLIGVLALAS